MLRGVGISRRSTTMQISMTKSKFALLLAILLIFSQVILRASETHGNAISQNGRTSPVASLAGNSQAIRTPGPSLYSPQRRPKLPLAFEENRGQRRSDVLFTVRGQKVTASLTSQGVSFALPTSTRGRFHYVQMRLIGSNPEAAISGIDRLPIRTNYLLGSTARTWNTKIASFARVLYQEVYPGVDLIYYNKDGNLEYDLRAAPGARIDDIVWEFSTDSNQGSLHLARDGDLIMQDPGLELHLKKPTVYQMDRAGNELPVSMSYRVIDASRLRVGFRAISYDPNEPLVIDPVLTISTYLGGSSLDRIKGVAVDATGDVYVTGGTFSADFPVARAEQATFKGNEDLFITKIAADGSGIIYSTYLGGSAAEQADAIAVDGSGNVYVTGQTNSADFPTTPGAFQTKCNVDGTCGASSHSDAFIAKLSSDGSQLVYSGFLGGSNDDRAGGIAVDSLGNAYITGGTFSTDFPTTVGAFNRVNPGGENVFAAKINPTGSALIYSTYLGPGEGFAAAIDTSGNAFIAGAACGTYPTTPGAFQTSCGNPSPSNINDAFVTKLDPTGSTLIYSTFIGGSNEDFTPALAIDSAGNAYIAGQTFSSNFPIVNAFQPTLHGVANAYVAKLNPTGNALAYSTYLGGSGDDSALAIAVDSSGNAYVTGLTQSADFPTLESVQQASGGGGQDAFVSKLDSNGVLQFSTFLGGSKQDQANALAIDPSGNIWVGGETQSLDFPLFGALQANGSGGDAFLEKIAPSTPAPDFVIAFSPSAASVAVGGLASYTLSIQPVGGFAGQISLSCTGLPQGTTCFLTPQTINVSRPGIIAVTVGLQTTSAVFQLPPKQTNDTMPKGDIALLFAMLLAVIMFIANRVPRFPKASVSQHAPALVMLLMLFITSCGGGGSGTATRSGATPPGTYTIMVSATSGQTTHSAAATLQVK
jgi:hypothetical protein